MRLDNRIPFQSTCPVLGRTCQWFGHVVPPIISIHLPRVGQDLDAAAWKSIKQISIHLPRVGQDS